MRSTESSARRDPRLWIVDLPQGVDVGLGRMLAAVPDNLAADRCGVVRTTTVGRDPLGDGRSLGVAHHGHHVAVVGVGEDGVIPSSSVGVESAWATPTLSRPSRSGRSISSMVRPRR